MEISTANEILDTLLQKMPTQSKYMQAVLSLTQRLACIYYISGDHSYD